MPALLLSGGCIRGRRRILEELEKGSRLPDEQPAVGPSALAATMAVRQKENWAGDVGVAPVPT